MVNTINSGNVTGSSAYTPVNQNTSDEKTTAAENNSNSSKDTVTIGSNTQSSGIYTKADGNKTHAVDASTIEGLKSQADRATAYLRSIVEKLILKQGDSSNLTDLNPDDIEQAKQAISEDGEFGVKQVSDRIANFAIAISGGDKTKLSQLKDAIEKGFDEVTKAFGGELPGICGQTHDEIMKKLDAWASQDDNTSETTAAE
jgi:hypothetical protein